MGLTGAQEVPRLILQTGTEELAHIGMLSTAVALNLQGAADGGATENLPTLNSFPQAEEKQEFSYAFLAPVTGDGPVPAEAAGRADRRSTRGRVLGPGRRPLGDEPVLPAPFPEGFARPPR